MERASGEPGAGNRDDGFVWRDRDPPPTFSGNPEDFKGFLRELKIWRHETDVTVRKHGAKLLRVLQGSAKAVVGELDVDVILSEQGVDEMVKLLTEHYQPHLEQTMPRAFERAVYGEPRKGKESFGEYILRAEQAFRALAEEGVKLDDTVKGYIMFRQANLSQTQEDQLTTWTSGRFERTVVVAALRRLEKVQREKSSQRHYMAEETEEGELYEDDSNEEFIYIGEQDLQEIYEEEDLQEALATYQQVRKAIKDQKTSRGYFQPKGLGKSSNRSRPEGERARKGDGKSAGRGVRIHVDVLKLRTKCAKCGQIGHWAKERTNEPDARGRAKGAGGGSSNEKVGFFEVGTVDNQCMHVEMQLTLGQCFRRRDETLHASHGQQSRSDEPFHGLTTNASIGVVDTAAQGGLIGKQSLQRLSEDLKQHGLYVQWSNKKAQARGIGGEAKVCGVVHIPIVVAGICGVIEATVVEDEVPFLLSIQFLREVQAVVDISKGELVLGRFGRRSRLRDLPSGHIAVGVLEFPHDGWRISKDALQSRLADKDFRTSAATPVFNVTFMSLGGSAVQQVKQVHHELQASGDGDLSSNVQNPVRDPVGGCLNGAIGSFCTGSQELGASHVQGGRTDGSRRAKGAGGSLARRWLHAWIICGICGALVGCSEITFGSVWRGHATKPRGDGQGAHLYGVDQGRRVPWTETEQGESGGGRAAVYSSSQAAEGRWQPCAEGGVVSTVSGQIPGGPSGDGAGAPEGAGDRGEREDHGLWSKEPSGEGAQVSRDAENPCRHQLRNSVRFKSDLIDGRDGGEQGASTQERAAGAEGDGQDPGGGVPSDAARTETSRLEDGRSRDLGGHGSHHPACGGGPPAADRGARLR